ncbi:putative membrane protein [Aestuariispira insulae]|uniref:Putative membrane protein n=2 Tax=Aestuariispira insulae TaxID=1461337 RepID=A0A3D9HVA2_9PROT|nr:putative membrane protein [Aestuariispira insulae]
MPYQILSILDWVCMLYFMALWVLYTLFADHSQWARKSLTTRMNQYREMWMVQMVKRDMKMIDTTILGNLMTGIAFFASTAMLILGGTVALLSNSSDVSQAISHLPFSTGNTTAQWEFKVLFLALIFVYAFFKFAWAFRLTNYCNIMVGSSPSPEAPWDELEKHARRAAKVSRRSGYHFNHGLRAYFFGSAALAWFFNPVLMIAAATLVVYVLYRREFSSNALLALKDDE